MKKNILPLVSLFLFIFTLSSCDMMASMGLGNQVDITQPVLALTELQSDGTIISKDEFVSSLIYCHKNITLKGTAVDDIKMDRVYAEVKVSESEGGGTYAFLKNAELTGTDWVLPLKFEEEGAVTIRITAVDKAGYLSSDTCVELLLFVDETGPVGSGWNVDRGNGISYKLKDLNQLKAVIQSDPELENSENIDVGQNVSFLITAEFDDAFGIKENSITITLRAEDGTEIIEVPNGITSTAVPEFNISYTDFSDAKFGGKFDSGKHYIEVLFSAEDIITVPHSNISKDVSAGWFLYWPESDKPRVVPNAEIKDGKIQLNVRDALNLVVFDDDGLKSVDYELIDENDYVKGQFTDAKKTTEFSNERTGQIILTAPETPHTMYLLTQATDVNDVKGDLKAIPVIVTDASSPMLVISSPENNKVPQVKMNAGNTKAEITVTGQTLDSAGCDYLEFVWVPDAVPLGFGSKNEKAKNWLENLDSASKHNEYVPTGSALYKETDGTGENTGLKLWSVKLEDDGKTGNFIKQKFSFTVDLLSDFKDTFNGAEYDETKNSKYFLVKLTRKDGKSVYYDYTLLGDNILPTVVSISPSSDTEIVEDGADLTLEFKGTKESGLAMKKDSYKIKRVDEQQAEEIEGAYDPETDTYKAVFKKEVLQQLKESGTKPKFEFSVEDLFGNKGLGQYTIEISSLPQLNSITSTAPAVCKKGDKIIINANFTNTVGVDADHQTGNARPYLKLTNINGTANDRDKAYYESGSGSPVLQFAYTVQEGDTSDQIRVDNTGKAPIEANGTLSLTKVHLDTLEDEKNLQQNKTIKIDGVMPKVTGIEFSTTAVADENKDAENRVHLKAGRKLTATVKTGKAITIQGDPSFEFDVYKLSSNVKTGTLSLNFESAGEKEIVFSTVIKDSDINGRLFYNPAQAIKNAQDIKDSAGNLLVLQDASSTDASLIIDTSVPERPVVINADNGNALVSGKYKNFVNFKLNSDADISVRKIQYSLNGGSKWQDYEKDSTVRVKSGCQLTARRIDYAGNVSDLSASVNIDINTTFPSYTLECTEKDGNYNKGKEILFRITFAERVNIAANADAKIYLNAADAGNVNGPYAVLSNKGEQKNVISAEFTYTVQEGDQFTLNVAAGNGAGAGVHLDGITDLYGFYDTKGLAAAYNDRNIVLDSVAPSIQSMSPSGETAPGSNIYTNGREITIKFSEPVQKGTGNIILRQVSGWAIPPVISLADFNKILNAIPADFKIRGLTGSEILYMNAAEDMRDLNKGVNYKNDYYHGTGHYVGPYKKSSYGLNDKLSPDVTPCYVLDFDMGIWETAEEHHYGKTYGAENSATPIEPETVITADDIRSVLAATGYHERKLDVTSAAVKENKTDSTEFTIKFPKGLTGSEALQDGRKWELVIEKGAFLDYTGNEFGAESEVVEISIENSNGQEFFWSDKVALPVIRIDRYSYGIGTRQFAEDGTNNPIADDKTKPTGYVRTRIDCETEGAAVKYAHSLISNSREDGFNDGDYTENYYNAATGQKEIDKSTWKTCYSYITSTSITDNLYTGDVNLLGNYEKDKVFASGNGNYKKSCKDYIVAVGTKDGFTSSERAKECAFQTVVRIYKPDGNIGILAEQNDDQDDFSIRGTTGWGGEPSISPFPLRDSRSGSPYLRRCFIEKSILAESRDYYWLSYEILVGSSFSGYACYGSDPRRYDWCQNWGYMEPGEFVISAGIRTWG